MAIHYTHSLHHIENEENLTFDLQDYSKFKHGSKAIARKFGHALSDSFWPKLTEHIGEHGGSDIVVLSSPYENIPTASFTLKNYFLQRLNFCLSLKGYSPAIDSRFYREQKYSEDFSLLEAGEREKILKNDIYYVDKEMLRNRLLLCIDDVKITGTHERKIQEILQEQKVDSNVFFIYFAQLNNPHVSSTIESQMNQSSIKTLQDLEEIINIDDFDLNCRTTKFILQAKESELLHFIDQMFQSDKESLLYHIYYSAIGNKYYNFDKFKHNLKLIESYLDLNINNLL